MRDQFFKSLEMRDQFFKSHGIVDRSLKIPVMFLELAIPRPWPVKCISDPNKWEYLRGSGFQIAHAGLALEVGLFIGQVSMPVASGFEDRIWKSGIEVLRLKRPTSSDPFPGIFDPNISFFTK
jgi:hypothetical protein